MSSLVEGVLVAPSGIEGAGVFAARQFVAGDAILAIDDSRIVNDAQPLYAGEDARHCDYLETGKVVLMQVPERFINHSCDPNTFVKTRGNIRFVVARRIIAAGEEITYDYSINSSGDTVWNCRCGAARCRRTVHSDFFHLPFEMQREYLPLLDDWYRQERADDVALLETKLAGL